MNKDTRKKTVSILGCGWLGTRLSDYLISRGYQIKGSTTRASKVNPLKAKKIDPFLIRLTPQLEAENIEQFLDSETLIINIPPAIRRRGNTFHPQQLNHLIPYIASSCLKNIIYISSTSVYPEHNLEMNEDDLVRFLQTPAGNENKNNSALLQAETLIQSIPDKNITILRPGGLIGDDRIPGKYVAGNKGLKTGAIPVNYIHPVDLVRIIEAVIEKQIWNDTFNVVAPEHPTRRQVYTKNIHDFGYEAVEYDADLADFKMINADKIIDKLGYTFFYPDPLQFSFNPNS